MGYNTEAPRVEYEAGTAQTVFSFLFKVFLETDIVVYQTPVGETADDATDILTLNVDYTVTITGDTGGSITLTSGATSGDLVTILRELPTERDTDYQTNGDLLADTLDDDQNYQTYLIADSKEQENRFLTLPQSAQGVSTTLPPPVPLSFMQWNAAGTALAYVNSLEADGYLWTAADIYTKAELDAGQLDNRYYTETEVDAAVAERRQLYAKESATITPTSDADYTLTASENLYGRFTLVDGSWTATHNIIVDTSIREIVVDNSTGTYTATIKTSAGTGIAVIAGGFAILYCDGTNVIENITGTADTTGVSYVDADAVGANPTAKIYPDGTVVGSTDNGSYIKYPNGKAEIEFTSSILITATTAGGAIYYTNTGSFTFPIQLVSIHIATPSLSTPSNVTWAGFLSYSLTSTQLRVISASVIGSGYPQYSFKGTWK